jgi:hypothetical protein
MNYRWPIYLIGLTWTIPMVPPPLSSSPISLTPLPDTTSKLPNPHPQSPRLLHLQHQSSRDPLLRALHPTTPVLDLAFREDKPEIFGGAHEPGVGDPAVDCA